MIGHKTYHYERVTVYYLTIGGIQFGPPMFSLNEMKRAYNRLK